MRLSALGVSVIPLKPRSKEPLIPWAEFQEGIATEDEISGWFAKWPDANLGLTTGRLSGMVVVDADGADGRKSLTDLKIHSSTSVLTGNGKQIYFRYPEEEQWIKNAVRKYPGIDIRADGGYVVCPPSIHPSGKRYSWLTSPLVNIQSLPLFPLVMFADTKPNASSLKVSVRGSIGDLLSKLETGNRNDTFCRIVGSLHRDGWTSDSIVELLAPHCAKVHFEMSELDQIIKSVSRYAVSLSKSASESSSETLENFLQASKPVEWIVPGIIARNSLGFVAGLPETGKTWLLIDLAIALARSQSSSATAWLGQFPVNPATVLFIDQERFKGETQRRFKSVLSAKRLTGGDCGSRLIIQCGTSTRVDNDIDYIGLRDKLRSIRPDVVIVDSFATFHTSEENDRGQIQKVLERIKQLRNEFSCAFVFIDHETKSVWANKDNGEAPSAFRMAGSVGKAAAAEFVLTVRKSGNGTCVYHTKSTLGKAVDAFNIEIKDTANGGISVRVAD